MWKKKNKIQNQKNDWQQQYEDEFQSDINDQLDKIDTLENKRQKQKEYYVKGADLKQEIRKYQQSKRKNAQQRNVPYEQRIGQISEQLGTMIIKICTRFSMHPRFYGYSYRDQFVADAVARCITHGVNKINLDLPNCNPFAYFTQCAYNVFRQKIKSQKKYCNTKQRLRQEVYTEFENQERLQQTKDNDDQ